MSIMNMEDLLRTENLKLNRSSKLGLLQCIEHHLLQVKRLSFSKSKVENDIKSARHDIDLLVSGLDTATRPAKSDMDDAD